MLNVISKHSLSRYKLKQFFSEVCSILSTLFLFISRIESTVNLMNETLSFGLSDLEVFCIIIIVILFGIKQVA